MTDPRTARPALDPGWVGVGAGLLYAAMVCWERIGDFRLGDPGAHVAVEQTLIVLAMLGHAVLAVGLYRDRPGGDGPVARVWPLFLAAGWVLLAAAVPVEALTSVAAEENPLNPAGGLAQQLGLLGLGVTVLTARRWTGWRRWFPLPFALATVLVVVVAVVTDAWPAAVLEVAAALGYSVLGWALVTGRRSRTAVPVG